MKTCRRGHPQNADNFVPRTYRGATCNRCRACEAERSRSRYGVIRDNYGAECDCGQPKKPTAEACPSCEFLDGRATAPLHGRIIAELRLYGELTVSQIARAVFGGKSGADRSVIRTLAVMVKDGRVQRRFEEGDVYVHAKKFNGHEFIGASSNSGRYVYRLTAPARGEIGRAA